MTSFVGWAESSPFACSTVSPLSSTSETIASTALAAFTALLAAALEEVLLALVDMLWLDSGWYGLMLQW